MKNKMNTLTKAILTACCLLLLNISIKAQSNTVTIGNMNTNYVTALSPFDNYYNYSWADNIYLTTDIGQAGKITQIAFYVYEGTTYSMGNQQILMRETSSSSFSSSSYPGTSGFTSVFNGTISYNFSGGNGWQVITLTTPFQYDGLSNLEVLTLNQSGTYTNSYNFFDVTTGYSNNRMRTDYNDASFPSSCVNCGSYTNLTNIQLTMVCTSTMTVSPSSATICNGNSTSLSASGESTYAWSPSTGLSGTTGASVTANPTVTTVYTVAGTDASSCTQTKTITVTVNPQPTISVSPSTPTICIGSSTTLTASGATSYAWSPTTGLSASTGASVTANPTSTTTYTVTGTGSNGCTKSQTVVVTVNPAPSLTFSPSSPAVCIGSTTTVTASGAGSYTWSPSTGLNTTTGASVSANPSVTTVYSINATGSNGCTGTQSLTVTVNPLPTLTLSPSSPAVCNGSTTTLTATGATTYSWSPATNLSATTGASITANPTTATNYTLTGTNSNGCVNTKAFSVAVNALPSLSINPSSATICTGTSTNLTASGATTYTWSPNTGLSATTGSTVTANPTATQTYSISGTNANGCVGTTTVTVNVNPLPTLSISATPTAICVGFSSNLTVSGATTYTWSPSTGLNNTNTSNVTANPGSSTVYTATGTNSNGCVGTQTINLIVNPLPNLSINPSTPIVLGGQGPTITANGANTYSWSPATNLSSTSGNTVTANPQITTNYTLTGTSSAGCVSNDIFSVGVELWQQTADTFHAPIYYNGNVGIGTNNPQAALDVVGNAIVTGTLTAGGLNSTNGNLNVSTPAVFTNSVTVSSLANSNASGDRMLVVDPSGHILSGGSIGAGSSSPWTWGGNSGTSPNNQIGTIDATDFVLSSGVPTAPATFNDRIHITQNGLVGVSTVTVSPLGLLHLNTQYTPTLPGLIVDDNNPTEGPKEFVVNSDGSTVITDNTPLNGDILSVNVQTQTGQASDNYISNLFRITNVAGYGARVGIGTGAPSDWSNPDPLHPVSAYKMLTVNGDASFANKYGETDGLSALEILGGGQIPTRRGISTDNNGSGNFNFFINSQQTNSQFNFLDGNGNKNLLTLTNTGLTSSVQTTINSTSTNIYTDALIVNDVTSGSPIANFKVKTTGYVYAREVVVTLDNFPDYVFAKNYELMPLSDVKKYIEIYHHLPNMPSAKEIQKDGASLGEIQRLSVEKIEELTLYMIDMKKELEKSQKEIEKLKQENKELKLLINK